ncbi:polysaccharide deacetylase family protein [Microbacterium xylanilyticum]
MSGGSRARSHPKGSSRAVIRRRWIAVAVVALLAVALVAVVATTALHAWSGSSKPETGATPVTETPKPTPLSPVQALLKTAVDPAKACAVSFQGDGITQAPMLQTEGVLYTGLPIPERAGSVFAGWYPTPEAAQAQVQTDRVNGSQLTACSDHQRTLYAAWTSPEQNTATAAKIPILMYHWFTTKPGGEDNWLHGNYIYIEDFKAQMAYIASSKFYLPTWDELNAFIDGKLFLPQHSLIITDDDNEPTWFQLAVPVVTADKLLATSFVITSTRQEGSPSPYVLQRSHTNDMHRAGDNGKGRMVNLSADEVAADLEKSAQILGTKEVVAYPFGHYNSTAEEGVTKAGFPLARTTEYGMVKIGTPKLELPVVRVNYGDTADDLKRVIG